MLSTTPIYVGALSAICVVGLLLVTAYFWGELFTGRVFQRRADWLTSGLLAIAVGLSGIGCVTLLLGLSPLARGLHPSWAIVAITGVIVLIRGRFSARQPTIQRKAVRWSANLGFFACLPVMVLTVGPALCPPTGWDELVYHHELPRRWLADQWPAIYSDLPYSGFPSSAEVLFWLVAPGEGTLAPHLLTWCGWVMALALCYRLLRCCLRPVLALTMLAALFGSSALLMVSANCYVECLQLLNVAAMLVALRHCRPNSQRLPHLAVILGILAGGTVATKLTGAPVLALPVVWFVSRLRKVGLPEAGLRRPLLVYLATVLLMELPFYLRPWVITGDPFYPYFCGWFSDDPARLEMTQFHHALGSAFGVPGPIGLLIGPVLLAFDRQLYDGDFGWQLVLLVGLAGYSIFSKWPKNGRFFRVVGILGLYLFWFVTAQQARFLIPAVVLLTLESARGLRGLSGGRRQLAVGVLVVATAVSVPWGTAGHYLGSWMCLTGLISQQTYVDESTSRAYVPLVTALREQTPESAKLMMLFEHRGFYLPRQHQIGTPFFQEQGFTPPENFATSAAILAVLRREQITHVVVSTRPTGPDTPAAWVDRLTPFLAALNECVAQRQLVPVWESDRHILYELRAGDP